MFGLVVIGGEEVEYALRSFFFGLCVVGGRKRRVVNSASVALQA